MEVIEYIVYLQRLGEIVAGPLARQAGRDVRGIGPGHHDDLGLDVQPADVLEELQAVHLRHLDVAVDDVDIVLLHRLQAFQPVLRGHYGITPALKHVPEPFPYIGLIVNDQDLEIIVKVDHRPLPAKSLKKKQLVTSIAVREGKK